MARTFSGWIYIFSFVASVVILLLGLSIGLVIEKERLQVINTINLQQEIDLESLQLQQIYMEKGELNCEAMNKIMESSINDVSDSMDKVVKYNKNSMIDTEMFRLQLRDYFLKEIRFFLLSKDIEEKCENDAVTVFYFYNEDNQDTQGDSLDYLKKIFGNKLLVFSFDSNFKEEPLIEVLLEEHNLTIFPSVIVDDIVYEGGITTDELMNYICDNLDSKPIECSRPYYNLDE